MNNGKQLVTLLKILLSKFWVAKNERNRKWWTDECNKEIENRRHYKVLVEQDDKWNDKYEEARINCRNTIRQARRKHLEDVLRNMQSLIRSNETRKFYQEVRTAKKGYQPTA